MDAMAGVPNNIEILFVFVSLAWIALKHT
jgi:hypothetical protein